MGTTTSNLQRGQIAVYPNANYQGTPTILGNPNGAFSGPMPSYLVRSPISIQIAPWTQAVFKGITDEQLDVTIPNRRNEPASFSTNLPTDPVVTRVELTSLNLNQVEGFGFQSSNMTWLLVLIVIIFLFIWFYSRQNQTILF